MVSNGRSGAPTPGGGRTTAIRHVDVSRMTSETQISSCDEGVGQPTAGVAGAAVDAQLHALLLRWLAPLVRLCAAQGAALRLLSDDGDLLHLAASLNRPAGVCAAVTVARHGCVPCGEALDARRVVWATDLGTCQPGADDGAARDAAAPPAPHMLVLPLRHGERMLGVCTLYFAAGNQPAPDLQALLEPVGELLGLALDKARLDAESQHALLNQARQAMSAEVHDSLAQSLTFVRMRMPLLRDAVLAHDDERALGCVDDMRAELGQAHASLRCLLSQWRAPVDPLGLVHALGSSADDFRRRSGAALEVVNELPGLKLSAEQDADVTHIVQEALANVARHAAASHARLHIAPAASGGVQIVVEDDGTGIAATATGGGHHGMAIMRERALRIGGTLEVAARQGGGTRVRLAFPLTAGPTQTAGERH